MFHMNLTKTPTDNVENLRKRYPQLEVKGTVKAGTSTATDKQQKGKDAPDQAEPGKPMGAGKRKSKDGQSNANPNGGSSNAQAKAAAPKGRKTKGDKAKPMELTMPTANPRKAPSPLPPPAPAPPPEETKSKRRARSPVESDEEDNDSDSDIGLTIEYPDGNPSSFQPSFPPSNLFNPPFPTRRFSEYVRGNEDDEGDDDADIEFEEVLAEGEDDEDTTGFKLPSPVSKPQPIEPPARFEFETSAGGDNDADADGMDFEADLEAELLKEWEKVNGAPEEAQGQGHDSDSSMSEEE